MFPKVMVYLRDFVTKDWSLPAERNRREDVGSQYIESLLKPYDPDLAKLVRESWLEYEDGPTPEAQYVKESDKYECMMQAYEYELQTYGEADLEEFQGLKSKITSPHGKVLLDLL